MLRAILGGGFQWWEFIERLCNGRGMCININIYIYISIYL